MQSVTLKDVKSAYERISHIVHKTPVITNSIVNERCGRKLFFKCELFQKTGSFKARGACNAILSLKEYNNNIKGIVTHSSGNHGQAVAFAAKVAGLPCSVVVPEGSSKAKTQAIEGYGAQLEYCKANPTSRSETCARISKDLGYEIIHPFDNYNVMAGQGTIALEFLEQVPDLDAILVPISGGGMTAGICIATKGIKPSCKVFAVEPWGKELQSSLEAKARLWPNPPTYLVTIADALRYQQVGNLTFPILCEMAETTVFTVSDAEITSAMKLVWERMKVVIEPAAATGVAAALSQQMKNLDKEIQHVGIILCGGNVDLSSLPWMNS